MYHTLLVPLDGSALGEQALPMAATLARATRARLLLLRVTGADPNEMKETVLYLRRLTHDPRLAGVKVEMHSYVGEAIPGILDQIQHHHADLVVMTTHGRSGVNRMVYGSVAEAVLSHSPAPVFLVRVHADAPPPTMDIGRARILVPLDGEHYAEHALPAASELAKALQATLVLLRVVTAPAPYALQRALAAGTTSDITSLEMTEATTYLQGVATRLRAQGLTVETILEAGGDPADRIIERSDTQHIDFIVMSTRGKRGLGAIFSGTTSLAVLRRGNHPVLILHPASLGPHAV